jgi:putative flippase GtrA
MFLMFGVVGIGATLIDGAVLWIGLSNGLSNPVARAISIFFGMHFAFAVNRLWAFKAFRSAPLVQQWAGYVLANITGALVNYGVFLLLTRPGAWFEHAPLLALAAGSGAGMFVNFGGSRLLAFRR